MNTVNFTGHVIDVAVDIVLCMALGLWMLEWSIGIEDWMNVWEMKPVVLSELELNVMIVIEIVLVWCLLWIEVY